MNSDRELLELAAKAAGRDVYWKCGMHQGEPHEGLFDRSTGHVTTWNPLTDDGDALRLAVKLQIQIAPGTYNKDEFAAYSSAGTEAKEYWSAQQDDLAATRRAIVRAAADIQRLKRDPL